MRKQVPFSPEDEEKIRKFAASYVPSAKDNAGERFVESLVVASFSKIYPAHMHSAFTLYLSDKDLKELRRIHGDFRSLRDLLRGKIHELKEGIEW